MITQDQYGNITITGGHIEVFRLTALKHALRLKVKFGINQRANLLTVARDFGWEGRTHAQALEFIEGLWEEVDHALKTGQEMPA